MKLLYVDAFSGISGDMTVGAFIALGVPLEQIKAELAKLSLGGCTVTAQARQVHGIAATKYDVHVAAHGHHHRAFRDIRDMLQRSAVDAAVQRLALQIFTKLAEAEGRVHHVAPDDVEFHEVGAVDSIADIVGAAVGFVALGIESTYVSTLPLGSGIVQSQHGPLPVPAPATVELLRGFSTRPGDGEGELVTPTGAAIVATVATRETVPDFRVQAVGYGAGQRVLKDRPNLLRLVVGEPVPVTAHDDLIVLETNIDDFNPELYDYVIEQLFGAGARDVYLTPIHMKKNRPGTILSVLCTAADRERLSALVMNETSAIGIRFYPVRRSVLPREIRNVVTPYGVVRVKMSRSPDGRKNLAPEYEDCKRVARERAVPIKAVYQAALAAALAVAD